MSTSHHTNAVPVPVVEVQGLKVSYRRHGRVQQAVRDVDLRLHAGEILALVGESGSGKSSLASALLGLHDRTTTVEADMLRLIGADMRSATERSWRELRRRVISLVPQDPLVSLNPTMRIGQQVREGLQLAAAHGEIEPTTASLNEQAVQALQDAGLDAPEQQLHQYPHELSGGQRQRALIAIALACRPQVIVADEPTSALDVTVQRRILDHLEQLVQHHGISLILITHDLAIAAERSHQMLVLEAGRVAEQGATHQLLTAPQSDATRQLLAAAPRMSATGELEWGRYRDKVAELPAPTAAPQARLDSVRKVYHARSSDAVRETKTIRALDDVTLQIPRGQTLGIVGESGSGKSTLLRVALALTQPTSGAVEYEGQRLQSLSPGQLRRLRRHFQLVQQDPYASLDPRYTVGRCIAEPLDAFRIGTRKQRRARVQELLELVELPAEFADRLPRQLSGGQRQRVAIARALASEPQTIYFDEPVSALDVTVQSLLLDRLIEIQRRLHITYVFVSHDFGVIARIAHRIVVMRAGKIVEEGTTPQVLGAPSSTYTQELIASVPRGLRNS